MKLEKLKLCEVRMSPMDSSTLQPAPRIQPTMTAHQIVTECERVGPGNGAISTSILPEGAPNPVPKKRHELPVVPPEQMLPPTPCVHVKSKQDAFSPQLLDWCLQRPITVIRGLAQACDLDLSLFTTKTLTLTHPHHPVEVRTQLEQSSDENWDPSFKEQVSSVSYSQLGNTTLRGNITVCVFFGLSSDSTINMGEEGETCKLDRK